MAVTTWTEEDVEAIIDAALAGECSKGTLIHHVGRWRAKYRERVLQNENTYPGYIESTVKGMSTDQPQVAGADDGRPRRVPAAAALRRLYDAKIGELTRYGVREPDRITIAVDYACSEVHRCQIEPMPPGGIARLEDDLYAAIGFDRVTKLRFTPHAS